MKKVFGTFFLLLFLYQCIGYMPVYSFFEYKVKKEVKRMIRAGMDNEQLELIKMPKSWVEAPPKHIEWEHSKEFILNGTYYDIVRTEEKGDDFYFYCYKDTKETALSIGLDKHTQDFVAQDSSKKETKETISSFFTKLFWYGKNQNITFFESYFFIWEIKPYDLTAIYLDNLSPPPEII